MSENQTFSGGIEMEHSAKMGQLIIAEINKPGPLLTWLCLRTLHICRVNKSYNVTAISHDASEYSEAFVGIFPVLSSDNHNLQTIQIKGLAILPTYWVGKNYKLKTLETVKLYLCINPNYPVGKYINVLLAHIILAYIILTYTQPWLF